VPSPASPVPGPLQGKRAVVVERNGIIHAMLSKVLRSMGALVDAQADSLRQVAEAVTETKPDLVLISPAPDEIPAAADAVRKVSLVEGVCTIVIIERPEHEQIFRGAGASATIIKPFSGPELKIVLEEAYIRFCT
jgi:AmiR/NasT family two-component response regulator